MINYNQNFINPKYAHNTRFNSQIAFSGFLSNKKAPITCDVFPDYGLDFSIPKHYQELLDEDKLKKRTAKYLENHPDIKKELIQKPENFYIDIEGYLKDDAWAQFMTESTHYATLKIRDGAEFEEVLKQLACDYADFSMLNAKVFSDLEKAKNVGVSRLSDNLPTLITPYYNDYGRYKTYYERFKAKSKQKSKKLEVPDFTPTQILHYANSNSGSLIHSYTNVKPGMAHAKQIYNELINNYKGKQLTKSDINKINSKIGEMHWFLANCAPYKRGSDCITTAFIKSLYSALGFKLSPARQGTSFDLEAFCTSKKEYSSHYTTLYQTPPKYIL